MSGKKNISNDEFRDMTRKFLSDMFSGTKESGSLNEQFSERFEDLPAGDYGRTESGNPQSYDEFYARLENITDLLEGLTLDYSDSHWLHHRDHGSLAQDLLRLFDASDKLRGAALGLSSSMAE